MSTSTNGQICYGIRLAEDSEYPWHVKEFEYDFDEWWVYGVMEFRHSFEIFDKAGGWLNGEEQPQDVVNAYFAERHDFERANPAPYSLINACSDEFPVFILAAVDTVHIARRGYPEQFDPAGLVATEAQGIALLEFCALHSIEVDGTPGWYLSSYWG